MWLEAVSVDPRMAKTNTWQCWQVPSGHRRQCGVLRAAHSFLAVVTQEAHSEVEVGLLAVSEGQLWEGSRKPKGSPGPQ